MKLKNKKTGEIINGYVRENGAYKIAVFRVSNQKYASEWYSSLAGLNEEWEDYEESKEYWCITGRGNLHYLQDITDENDKDRREIGNYFETEEEAEKAVEKLKAWKRLKDKGFRFTGFSGGRAVIEFTFDNYCSGEPSSASDDLDLLFGGEE